MKEKRRNKKKLTTLIALLMCAILAFGIAGSLAYYTSVSGSITNKFSTSSDENGDGIEEDCVSITLTETVENNNTGVTENVIVGETADVTLMAASDYTKTATVTVNDDSVACYVFILIEDTLSAVENEYVEVDYDISAYDVWIDGDYALFYFGIYKAGDTIEMSVDISVSENVVNASEIQDVEDTEIVFYSYAIQGEGVEMDDAITAAFEYYNSLLDIELIR